MIGLTHRTGVRRAAVVVVALILGAGVAQVDAAPSVSVTTPAVKYGAVTVVRGAGLPANARGLVRIGGVFATKVKSSRTGTFTARFRLPLVPPGRRGVVATVRIPGTSRFARANAALTVRPGMARVDHVVWIVMENRNYEEIIGAPDAPYANVLARRFGLATHMTAETHPSLPNYIAMTSGVLLPELSDSGPPGAHPLSVPSIFGQLNGDWRALQDAMPANCTLTNSGTYAVRHNPATYYLPVRSECATRDVPLADPPDLRAKFTFITPDLCNDSHDCPVASGDAWLGKWVPKILASPQFRTGRTVVFLTWDESNQTAQNHIATIVIAPTTRAVKSARAFNHYAMLRTTEELLGLPFIGAAAQAPSMRTAFGL